MMKLMNWYHALGLAAALGTAGCRYSGTQANPNTPSYDILPASAGAMWREVKPLVRKVNPKTPGERKLLASRDTLDWCKAAESSLKRREAELQKCGGVKKRHGKPFIPRTVPNQAGYLRASIPVNLAHYRVEKFIGQYTQN